MTYLSQASICSRHGQAMALTRVSASGIIEGLMLNMQIMQSFINPLKKEHAEVMYTFPLPSGAVLLDIDVVLGDKKLSGKVVPRQKAEVDYEEAISEGNTALMLEELHDGSYCLSIGNLAPGEACTLTMHYAQCLRFNQMDGQNALRLTLPTVIAPRYEMADVLPGKRNVFGKLKVPKHDLSIEYPFDISMKLAGELAQARVASPSHAISVVSRDAAITVSLARKGNLDRDFILNIDQFSNTAFSVTAPDYHQPGQVALLTSFCPELQQMASSEVAIKILVDCSGSMSGSSIQAARLALKEIVGQLSASDRISLSRFGSEVQHRSPAMWKFGKPSQAAALRWIDELDANLGGTEMALAVQSTLEIQSSTRSDILLITDGDIDSVDSLITSACAAAQRVFIVGIGSSPAEVHLERLAMATGGACEYVAPGEEITPAILRMFQKLRSPVWSGVRIVHDFTGQPLWSTPLPKSVFSGDTLNMFYLLPGKPCGSMALLGSLPGQDGEIEIARLQLGAGLDTGAGEEADASLSRMAAATYMQSLQAAARRSGELSSVQQQVQELGVQYQLISSETSFLIVEEVAEEDKPIDMPALLEVKHMVPAGWSGMGAVAAGGIASLSCVAPVAPVCSAPFTDQTHTADLSKKLLKRSSFAVGLDSYSGVEMERGISVPPAHTMIDADAVREFEDYASEHGITNVMSYSMHYQGLTPLGMSMLARYFDASLWPDSFAKLKLTRLGEAIREWLEFSVWGEVQDSLTEKDIIALFFSIMAEAETLARLIPAGYDVQQLQGSDRTAVATASLIAASSHPDACQKAAQQLRQAVQESDGGSWSEGIFLLGLV